MWHNILKVEQKLGQKNSLFIPEKLELDDDVCCEQVKDAMMEALDLLPDSKIDCKQLYKDLEWDIYINPNIHKWKRTYFPRYIEYLSLWDKCDSNAINLYGSVGNKDRGYTRRTLKMYMEGDRSGR